MIDNEQDFFLIKPIMIKPINANPTYAYTLKDYSSHRKQKCIDEDETRYQNSVVRETIGEIYNSNHDKKTHKNRFGNGEYLLDDTHDTFYSVEFLKCKYGTNDPIANKGNSDEVRELDCSLGEYDTRDQVG